MGKNVNLMFLKDRFYNGKQYKKGEVVNMGIKDANSYIEYGSGKIVQLDKNNFDIKNLSYKSLRNLCKEKNIDTTGKKEELIERLKEIKEV